MFSDLWRREWQNRNAMEIVKRGEALYEKIAGFIKTFEEVGNSIKSSQDKYDRALGQLKDGKGNVINQAEQLRKLGLKSEKKISVSLLPNNDEDMQSADSSRLHNFIENRIFS
jgi:DNA recombination protein RmuC